MGFPLKPQTIKLFAEGSTATKVFGLVWLEIDGTDLDGFHSIYQGHLFSQKDTYGLGLGAPEMGGWVKTNHQDMDHHVSICQGNAFWVPIFDPQPYGGWINIQGPQF